MKRSIFIGGMMILMLGVSAAFGQTEIQGGIVNGKAISLPKPEYTDDMKLAGIGGVVKLSILIDENGDVISAEPIVDNVKRIVLDRSANSDGSDVENYTVTTPTQPNPLLVDAARNSALKAKFAPTMLSGVPVRVRGILVYKFSAAKPKAVSDTRTVSGGVVNGKAKVLPAPEYPAAAKAVMAGGTVNVQVVIDENGDVIAADAVSGHPLLRRSAADAAMSAKFAPTKLQGQPVQVTGILTYNFVP